jgi:ABC-type transport system substrate-binding protein
LNQIAPAKRRISRGAVVLVIIAVVVAAVNVATYAQTNPLFSVTNSIPIAPKASLAIDDWAWPLDDLNQLYCSYSLPWPNWLAYTVYQPLVSVNETAEYGAGSFQFIPALSTNWSVTPDGRTYTFDLRQGVNFSNGDPFNSYELWLQMYGIRYLTGNSSTWFGSYDLFDMSNVTFGRSTFSLINASGLSNPSPSVIALMSNSSWPIYIDGASQIVFRLSSPFAYFLGLLAAHCGLVFDSSWVLRNGGFGSPSEYNLYFNLHPVPGTGPYIVTGVVPSEYVSFAQNPSYWGAGNSTATAGTLLASGEAKTVVIYAKSDDSARFSDLSSGAVQISAISSNNFAAISGNPTEYSYLTLPPWSGEISALAMNTRIFPTNITLVRQAIVHALNYSAIDSNVYLGRVSNFVGPEYPFWKQFYDLGGYTPYSENLTLAREDLAAAKISNMPTLLMRTISNCPVCTATANEVQSDLREIGITVAIQTIGPSDYYSVYGTYATNLANASQLGQLSFVNGGFNWEPQQLTPADSWTSFVSNSSTWGNWAVYYDPVVQSCVNAFFETVNASTIQALCALAQAKIYSDAPYSWIGISTLPEEFVGTLAWKMNVISSFMIDPLWNGENSVPLFNTVTFAT